MKRLGVLLTVSLLAIGPGCVQQSDPAGKTLDQWKRELGDQDPGVRFAAAEALGKMGREAIPTLTQALRNKQADVRNAAAYGFGKMGPNDRLAAISTLTEMLADREANAPSFAAIGALGNLGPDAIPALIELLHDNDPAVREPTAWTLEKMAPEEDKTAILALARALQDDSPVVRAAAASAFKRMGPKAVPLLTELLQDKDLGVRAMPPWLWGR